jgi:hypothetical protein
MHTLRLGRTVDDSDFGYVDFSNFEARKLDNWRIYLNIAVRPDEVKIV